MQKLRLKDLDVKGEKVLIRVDFNVPLSNEGAITDDTRIREALPSIQHVIRHGGIVILMSHLGRPKGKKEPKYSLAPCQKKLSELLGQPVYFVEDCIGPEVEKKVMQLKPGDILLLENLRFYPAEEDPSIDPTFAEKLARLGDLYVNDAFGTAHRKHSSTTLVADYFPKRAATGFLMEKELHYLSELLLTPKRPFYAIIGGAKVSTKIGVLRALLDKVDHLFIGGAMAYTFFHLLGISMGDSPVELDCLEEAKLFLEASRKKNIRLSLPKDLTIAKHFSNDAESQVISSEKGIPPGWQGMDIGPRTLEEWTIALQKAATLFWNGPVGVFEFPNFSNGTFALAKAIAQLPAITVVGGGDSVAAISSLGITGDFDHISTGGGASLEFIELGHLVGIDALSNA